MTEEKPIKNYLVNYCNSAYHILTNKKFIVFFVSWKCQMKIKAKLMIKYEES